MVDPKNTNERTVEIEAGADHAARKAWIKPRLDTCAIDETAASNTVGVDGAGAGHPGASLS